MQNLVISDELKIKIKEVVVDCFNKALPADKIPFVDVQYRTNMKRCAGLAYESNKIELNVQLLLAYTEKFISRTVVHEAAHLITNIMFPDAKQAHGPEWKHVMRIIGASDLYRTHSYDTSPALSGEYYRYVCGCDDHIRNLTPLRHKKINSGRIVLCRKCKSRLAYWPKEDNV